jgi:hypothetical protein
MELLEEFMRVRREGPEANVDFTALQRMKSGPSPAFGTLSPQAGRGDSTRSFSPPRGEKVPKADEGSPQGSPP